MDSNRQPKAGDAIEIVRRLRNAGHTAYLVGGYVRDMLRGKTPKDFDIATDATPDQVRRLFRHTVPVGVSFGVVLVIIRGVPYEVATFRVDLGYSDGRRPDEIRFATPREDAMRRDFTVNGIFYDPLEDEIIDYIGGRKDIERGVIRAIGDPMERFAEDKLRLLRAVRFSAALDFPIEEHTAGVVRERAADIKMVSAERIREELSRMLTGQRPRRAIELASDMGLLVHFLPEVEAMKGVEQPAQFHPEGDVWTHTMLALDHLEKPAELELALGALLHDVGKPPTYKEEDRIRFDGHVHVGAIMTDKIMRRLRFSKRQQELVFELVKNHLKFMNVRDMRKSKLKRFLRQDRFDLHLELHRVDCMASHANLDNHEFCLRKLEEFEREKEPLRPPRLINGKDLIELGLEPGPRFSVILKEIEDAQLESRISTRDEAIEFIRRNFIED